MAYTKPVLTAELDPLANGTWVNMETVDLFSIGGLGRIAIKRGVDYVDGVFVPLASDVSVTLRNANSYLNPRYSGNSHYGARMSNAPMRFKLTHSAATTNLWHGFLRSQRRVWQVGMRPKADVSARGLLSLVRDQKVSVPSTGALDVDEAIQYVLLACQNIDSNDYTLVGSNQVLDRFFAQQRSVAELLSELMVIEMGLLYDGKDGKITFTPRHNLLGFTLANSATDTWGGTTQIRPVMVEEIDDDAELLSSVQVSTTEYVDTTADNLVYYSEGLQWTTNTLFMAAGAAIGPRTLYPNQQGIVALAPSGTVTCQPYVDYRAASNADGTGTDLTANILVTLYQQDNQWFYWIQNQGAAAYLGHFWIRASGVVLRDGGQVMGTAGNTIPSATNDTTIGTVAWSNLANIASSNNVYTTAVLTFGQTSNYLKVKTPITGIKSNIVINGISFFIEAKRAGTHATPQVIKCAIVKAGVINTTTTREFEVTSTERVVHVGGTGDLWGEQWAAADFAHADFGIAIWVASSGGDTYDIDHVTAQVYFTEFVPYTSRNKTITRELSLPDGTKGGRTASLNLAWIASENTARDRAEQILRIGRYGLGKVRQVYKHTDDTIIQAMLAAEPGRLVKYTMPNTAWVTDGGDLFDDFFRIINVNHIIQNGALGQSEVVMVRAHNFRNGDKIAWDDFNRADNASSLGTTPTGTAWTAAAGFLRILNRKARPSTTAQALSHVNILSGHQVVEAKFSNLTASWPFNAYVGVAGRFNTTSNYAFIRLRHSASGTLHRVELGKIVAGTTTLASTYFEYNGASPPASIDFRLICEENRILGWANGRFVGMLAETNLSASTRAGIITSGTDAADVENFYAQALGT